MQGILHFKSNDLLSTILKIFCTLMECDVEQKMSGAFIAFANFRAFLWEGDVWCGNLIRFLSFFLDRERKTV